MDEPKVQSPDGEVVLFDQRVQNIQSFAEEREEISMVSRTCVLRSPLVITLLTQEEAFTEDVVEEKAKVEFKQSVGEAECYRVFCELFGKEEVHVQSRNIPWLINPLTHRHLELDIYVPRWKIACEYNGEQHYNIVSRFHRHGQESLDYQKWKDNVKVDLCDANGHYLITVPYWIAVKEIRQYILSNLPKGGYICPIRQI